MSLGFGFSLPALAQYGGGGTNPFGQLGPTLDLSFTGNAGNLSGTDTYTLDTNFITPQYQIAAQYAVWVAGSGLTQRNFADIVTFTRGTNATQFDSTGSLVYAPVNLLLRSESLATTAVWFNSGLTSITNNTPNTVDPAGGNTATELVVAASAGVVGQSAVLSGVNHTGSVWLRCASGTVTGSLIIYLTASPFTNIGTQAITITTTWQRFSVTTSSLPTAGTNYNFQIHNLSGGTVYAWGAQLNPTPILGGITSSLTTYYPTTTTAYYGPRFDYDPSTLAAQGLLIEEARTNLITSSAVLPAGVNVTITADTFVAPDGTTTGDQILDNATLGEHYSDSFFTPVAATNYTFSAFIKNIGASSSGFAWLRLAGDFNAFVGINLSTFTIAVNGGTNFVSSSIQAINNGWYKVSVTGLSVGTASTVARVQVTDAANLTPYSGTGKGFAVWGRQLEAGAFPTSYIPTTVAQVTRSADVASVNTLSPWFNSTAGTLYAEYAVSGFASASAFPSTAALSDGTGNNRINLASTNTGASLYSYGEVQAGGAPQAGFYGASGSPFGVGTARKVAIAYAVNDFAFTTQGLAVQADPSGTVPTVDRLYLGVGSTGTAQFQNGYLRRITYYPRRLANADLQTITI